MDSESQWIGISEEVLVWDKVQGLYIGKGAYTLLKRETQPNHILVVR